MHNSRYEVDKQRDTTTKNWYIPFVEEIEVTVTKSTKEEVIGG